MKKTKIPFNLPYTGGGLNNINEALSSGHLSGNGLFTKKCQAFFNNYFSAQTLLTTSGTAAIEMAVLLSDIKAGDEVIVPSFSFVSTANPFVLKGAKIIFADTEAGYPNLDASSVESLITKKTKAIVPVHYGGVACDMEKLTVIANQHQIEIIEDAAHAIGSNFKGKPLATFGRFGALSFHETKNLTSGEGGLIVINDAQDFERAEIVWEKGTNRAAFNRNAVSKYQWVDIGSSFLPSDINAAVLYNQIEEFDSIQKKRLSIWNNYYEGLQQLQEQGNVRLPNLPAYAQHNGHLFFLECSSDKTRDKLINFLRRKGIYAVFHYLPLHLSPFFKDKHDGRTLNNTVNFSHRIVRLPLFFSLKEQEQEYIIEMVKTFF